MQIKIRKRFVILTTVVVAVFFATGCSSRDASPPFLSPDNVNPRNTNQIEAIKKLWKYIIKNEIPQIFPANITLRKKPEGIKGVFFKGQPYKGKETRVFAWYGIPKIEKGNKVPAMVLLHGGGGTAFSSWVDIWNKKGYAAIAIDMNGCIPRLPSEGINARITHKYPGPIRTEMFKKTNDNIEDQWVFHAVSAAIMAHSFIRSQPGVIKEKTGVTGVSWGGFVAIISASIDKRFKCCIPVYACGFIGDDSIWAQGLKARGQDGQKWLRMWDPSNYLPGVKTPFFWIGDTNARYYPMPSRQKSYFLTDSKPTLLIKVRMGHNHTLGWKPEEIYAFADSNLKGHVHFPEISGHGHQGNSAWASFIIESPLKKAVLNFTRDLGPWKNRKWNTRTANVSLSESRVTAEIPQGTTVYYFNITDKNNLTVSSPHVELR
jgi:hypothetical protein